MGCDHFTVGSVSSFVELLGWAQGIKTIMSCGDSDLRYPSTSKIWHEGMLKAESPTKVSCKGFNPAKCQMTEFAEAFLVIGRK